MFQIPQVYAADSSRKIAVAFVESSDSISFGIHCTGPRTHPHIAYNNNNMELKHHQNVSYARQECEHCNFAHALHIVYIS